MFYSHNVVIKGILKKTISLSNPLVRRYVFVTHKISKNLNIELLNSMIDLDLASLFMLGTILFNEQWIREKQAILFNNKGKLKQRKN